VFLPSSTYDPSSNFMTYFVLNIVSSSSDDDSEHENPPPPTHLPPYESIEPELAPTPPLPRWVHST